MTFRRPPDYLTLLAPEEAVTAVVEAPRSAPTVHRKAKDLLRASRHALLPPDNPHVRKDLEKIADGKHLSPVLVVCGRAGKDVPLTFADGYHRICASHHLDENADVPCRLVAWP